MSPLDLRARIHVALHHLPNVHGTQYGQIKAMELLPPVPGEPVKLKITCPDPYGVDRVHIVSIEEE